MTHLQIFLIWFSAMFGLYLLCRLSRLLDRWIESRYDWRDAQARQRDSRSP